MKIIVVIFILFLAGVGYFGYQKTNLSESEQTVAKVKSRSEVQDFLKRVPDGIVEVDNELDSEYNIHVYEIKDGHTATFNWYRVDKKTGEVKKEF